MTEFFHFLFTEKELRDKEYGHICLYCGRLMIRAAGEYAYIASVCRLAKLWRHLAYHNKTSNYMDFELSNQIRNGVLNKELVENYYNEAIDSTAEIGDLLRELKITGGIEAIR